MNKKIHPTYYPNAKITCACGESFEVGSTLESMNTEICHKCHPLFTGKQKIIDTAGRVDRYKSRLKKKDALTKIKMASKAKKPRPKQK